MSWFKNWKTTTVGGVPALAVLLQQMAASIDNDPATNPSMTIIVLAIGALGSALFAKDSDQK